jgi:hypothetical protein
MACILAPDAAAITGSADNAIAAAPDPTKFTNSLRFNAISTPRYWTKISALRTGRRATSGNSQSGSTGRLMPDQHITLASLVI